MATAAGDDAATVAVAAVGKWGTRRLRSVLHLSISQVGCCEYPGNANLKMGKDSGAFKRTATAPDEDPPIAGWY